MMFDDVSYLVMGFMHISQVDQKPMFDGIKKLRSDFIYQLHLSRKLIGETFIFVVWLEP